MKHRKFFLTAFQIGLVACTWFGASSFPHAFCQEINANDEKKPLHDGDNIVYFEKQFGVAAARPTLKLEGDWLRLTPGLALAKSQQQVLELIEESDSKRSAEDARREFYPNSLPSSSFAPIRINGAGQLVIGNLRWNAKSGKFEASQQAWEITTIGKTLIVGADGGKILCKIELDSVHGQLSFHRFKFSVFERGHANGRLNGRVENVIGGKGLTILHDMKLVSFLEELDMKTCFEDEPVVRFVVVPKLKKRP